MRPSQSGKQRRLGRGVVYGKKALVNNFDFKIKNCHLPQRLWSVYLFTLACAEGNLLFWAGENNSRSLQAHRKMCRSNANSRRPLG